VHYFTGLQGSLAYSLRTHRRSTVFRDPQPEGCCLVPRLNTRLPTQKHTVHTLLRNHSVFTVHKQQTLGTTPVFVLSNQMSWDHRPARNLSPSNTERLHPHCLLGCSFALVQIPSRAQGSWHSAGQHMPNPEWGLIPGNQPFLALLNGGGSHS